jgi:hypothetical protein
MVIYLNKFDISQSFLSYYSSNIGFVAYDFKNNSYRDIEGNKWLSWGLNNT